MELKLYRPLKPALNYPDNYYHRTNGGNPPSVVGQFFGENKACRKPDGEIFSTWDSQCPVGSTSVYAEFELLGHNGKDIACRRGDPIFASHAGVISRVEGDKNSGYGVRVISNENYTIEGKQGRVETAYWHLLPLPVVKLGKFVEIGELIGFADSTGYSSGDHLHFGLKLKSADGITNLFQNNGYLGAIGSLLYIVERDARDVWDEKHGLKASLIVDLIILYYQMIAYMRFWGQPVDFTDEILKQFQK